MTNQTAADKHALRGRIRAARAVMPPAGREGAATAIARRGSDLLARTGARTIACYLSAPTEPPTHALIAAARAAGIRVLLPISGSNGILDWSDDDAAEVTIRLGVPETAGRPLGPDAIREAELLFIPAAAVDPRGMRMGWGRGYYDRALARVDSRRPVYAVLYDAEVVDRVPHEAHDVPVTGAVTPTHTLSFDR